jgi:hypothetical protein
MIHDHYWNILLHLSQYTDIKEGKYIEYHGIL